MATLSLFFGGGSSCHRNAHRSGKCARRSMRNLPFKYEPFSNRQPPSSSHSLCNFAEMSSVIFQEATRASSLSFLRMNLLQVEVYVFCFIVFSMIPTIWAHPNHTAHSLAKLHLRLILWIHLSGNIPSFSPHKRCCVRKRKNPSDTCIKAFIKAF